MMENERLSSSNLEVGSVITPGAPSVASYSFVPPVHLVSDPHRDTKSPTLTKKIEVQITPTDSPKYLTGTFYSNLGHFPFQIKQMTYSSDDVNASRKLQNNNAKQTMIETSRSEHSERLNRDIVRQVDHWMKNKPMSGGFMCSITPRVSYSPTIGRPLPREQHRRRRFRRSKVSDVDDKAQNDTSIVSQESEISSTVDPLRDTLRRRRHNISHDKVKLLNSRTSSDSKRGEKDKDKRSVYGSVHNEIEFQKRYRRMFDLNKHLQFVNSTNGLKGQKISNKKHHLPALPTVEQKQCLERSEMFAIETVTKLNDPEWNSVSPRTIWKNVSMDNSPRMTTFDTTFEKTTPDISLGETTLTKSDLSKFEKLPKINSDQNNESESESGVKTTRSYSRRETDYSKDSKSYTTGNKSRCNADDELSDLECSSDEGYAELQEMKVTISIRYKSESGKSSKRNKAKSRNQKENNNEDSESIRNSTNETESKKNKKKQSLHLNRKCDKLDEDFNLTSFDKIQGSSTPRFKNIDIRQKLYSNDH